MRVGIISDAHHYLDVHGRPAPLAGVARQFEQWALMFDQIVVCAPLLSGLPPAMHSVYAAANITLLPVHRAGGSTLHAKLGLAAALPGWWMSLRRLLRTVDAVHIRCPNNISILGLAMLALRDCPRHAIYTGNWKGYSGEPLTYRLQRTALKRWFKGPVNVYGAWPDQPSHIVDSFSPSIPATTWEAETESILTRLNRLRSEAQTADMRLLTVGTLDRNKNQAVVIRAVAALRASGHPAELRIAGDGPRDGELRELVSDLAVGEAVSFLGRVDTEILRAQYRWADFVVQPSLTEGFSKVTLEAMTHGAVPLLSELPVNAAIVEAGCGATFPANAVDALVETVLRFHGTRELMVDAVERGRLYAKGMTLEAWREQLNATLRSYWSRECIRA